MPAEIIKSSKYFKLLDKIRIVIDNRSTGKGKNPTLTLTDTFYIFRLLRLGRLAFVALVDNNGTEKMNPFVKLNRRKSKTCRILYAPETFSGSHS